MYRTREHQLSIYDYLPPYHGELAGRNRWVRLAEAIRKTQKRANALGNVQIPQMQATIKKIDEALSEKEREEFGRLKVIKNQKQK